MRQAFVLLGTAFLIVLIAVGSLLARSTREARYAPAANAPAASMTFSTVSPSSL